MSDNHRSNNGSEILRIRPAQAIQFAENMRGMHTWISSVPTARSNATERPPRQSSTDRQMPVTTYTIDENNNNLRIYPNDTTTTEIVLCDDHPCSSQFTNEELVSIADAHPSRWSGFLIDNCDGVQPSPTLVSSPDIFSVAIQQPTESSAMLFNEFDTACAERRERPKRRQPKKKTKLIHHPCVEQIVAPSNSTTFTNNDDPQELASDWIIEYDTTNADQISQLTDVVKEMPRTTTDGTKMARINTIVTKIKRQQMQLRKLQKDLIFMLHEESKASLTETEQDTLMESINQSTTSGCWLCSGKVYTEVASQCDTIDQ